jgi:glycosyltransferase involved in cell wall biosynthesis
MTRTVASSRGAQWPSRAASADGPHILLVVENVALARDHRLQKQVASLAANGCRVSVVCRADPANRRFLPSRLFEYRAPADATSKLGFVGEYLYSVLMAALLSFRVFLREPFDVIQVGGTPDIYFAVAAPFKVLGRPLVLDQRDLSPELYQLRYGRRSGLAYRVLRWLERCSYRAADHVITVNGSLEKIAYARGGLPPGRVSVVGNGPAVTRMRAVPPQPELKQGRRFLCCWVGMMGPQDRVDIAVRAVAQLVKTLGRIDCHFAFLGDGEARKTCEQLAAELGIAKWVTFTGWAGPETVAAYLSSADIGFETNLEDIVSPVKAMEYMAFGLPFASFDLRETRALAGDAATYAEPGDVVALATGIDELLGDPERRAQMGQLGRRRVDEHLAWERQEVTYLDVYSRVLARPLRRPDRSAPIHAAVGA